MERGKEDFFKELSQVRAGEIGTVTAKRSDILYISLPSPDWKGIWRLEEK
jgi:hypothetical protein